MTRYGMAIDVAHCVGCDQCSLACKMEHNLPDGLWWSRAKTIGSEGFGEGIPTGKYPSTLEAGWYTLACQHCDNPACVEVCPTGASAKREDGIVIIDWEVCIGCKSCMAACPYEGVRSITKEEPKWFLNFSVGDPEVPAHVANAVEKCTFCVERIDRGETPVCVHVCHALARYFGDLDDPESDVSKAIASYDYDQLLVDQGTGPNIYFLK